jgi:hypothetical protein
VAFALLTPPTLAGWAPEPFLLATVVFAQLVPAVLVTAAADGRAGVRDLVRRIFRWRVHPAWYAVAFLALPAAVARGGRRVRRPTDARPCSSRTSPSSPSSRW